MAVESLHHLGEQRLQQVVQGRHLAQVLPRVQEGQDAPNRGMGLLPGSAQLFHRLFPAPAGGRLDFDEGAAGLDRWRNHGLEVNALRVRLKGIHQERHVTDLDHISPLQRFQFPFEG